MANSDEMSDDEVFEVARALASGTASDEQVQRAHEQVERDRDN